MNLKKIRIGKRKNYILSHYANNYHFNCFSFLSVIFIYHFFYLLSSLWDDLLAFLVRAYLLAINFFSLIYIFWVYFFVTVLFFIIVMVDLYSVSMFFFNLQNIGYSFCSEGFYRPVIRFTGSFFCHLKCSVDLLGRKFFILFFLFQDQNFHMHF